ncbi:MAG: ABC transporter ATP-binding protein [Candidatus Rokubacteria bacterium]|nr:ABC transporter ATP-binding protein [Candidatus Rokubacteria bacterium]
MPLLEGRGLCVDYGRVRALDGIDVEVQEGQVIGLLGPNGSGKTTLLNVLGGLLRPTAGAVRFDGALVTGKPPWAFGRLGIGRTFQIPRPFAGLTVLDSVLVGVTLSKRRRFMRAADRRREGERLLAIVGLDGKAGARSSELSLGQMKRLELAVALSTRPRLLLLDELASGLSPQGRGEVLRFYGRLREHGITIVAVEHSVGTLASIADRLLLLDGGVIAAEGPPSAILASPRVAQAYLGGADE